MAAHRGNQGLFGFLFGNVNLFGGSNAGAHRKKNPTRAPQALGRGRTRMKYGGYGKYANTRRQLADRPNFFSGSARFNSSTARMFR